jgi:hypothetical protein
MNQMERLNCGQIFLQWFVSSLCVCTGCMIPRSKEQIRQISMVRVVVVYVCMWYVTTFHRFRDIVNKLPLIGQSFDYSFCLKVAF